MSLLFKSSSLKIFQIFLLKNFILKNMIDLFILQSYSGSFSVRIKVLNGVEQKVSEIKLNADILLNVFCNSVIAIYLSLFYFSLVYGAWRN